MLIRLPKCSILAEGYFALKPFFGRKWGSASFFAGRITTKRQFASEGFKKGGMVQRRCTGLVAAVKDVVRRTTHTPKRIERKMVDDEA
jgi:hypothetical protein